MGDLTKDFNRREYECNPRDCGCGKDDVTQRLADTVQVIRDAVGPVKISSGCRCKAHNARVGGKEGSAHTTGEAADIVAPGWSNKRLGTTIKSLYSKGLLPHLKYCYLIDGKTHTAVHVGVDNKKRNGVFGF